MTDKEQDNIPDQDLDADQFAKRTYKEVKIWDWLARILPLTVLTVLTVAYFFKWTNVIEIVLDATVIVFFLTCFVWWYWAIYKIAVAVKYIRISQEKFKEIKQELAQFKNNLKNFGRHND